MLISLCIPVHNRKNDLQKSLPYIIKEAKKATPFEISIVNYNSTDDLDLYLDNLITPKNVYLSTEKYIGRDYYHMSHARNLSVLMAKGKWIIIWCADFIPHTNFFLYVRSEIERNQAIWMHPINETEIIICRKSEFINAGGFDERIEFYGPEGKELNERLIRRNGPPLILPVKSFIKIHDSDDTRFDNYRLKIGKKEMHEKGMKIMIENRENNTLIANKNGWGSWA